MGERDDLKDSAITRAILGVFQLGIALFFIPLALSGDTFSIILVAVNVSGGLLNILVAWAALSQEPE